VLAELKRNYSASNGRLKLTFLITLFQVFTIFIHFATFLSPIPKSSLTINIMLAVYLSVRLSVASRDPATRSDISRRSSYEYCTSAWTNDKRQRY